MLTWVTAAAAGVSLCACALEREGSLRERADAGPRMDGGVADGGGVDAGPVDAGTGLPDRGVIDGDAGDPCARPEICNGLDDDCNGAPDDGPGFTCIQAGSTACVTPCGTPGRGTCNATCDGVTGPCLAPAEVCGNMCDDDGNGTADDGCPPSGPPNDHCVGASILMGSGVIAGISFDRATPDARACAVGRDLFYAVDLAQEAFVYLDTFGSAPDTVIEYLGTSCTAGMPDCADHSCGGRQSQWVRPLRPGHHVFALAVTSGAGAVNLTYRVVPAAGGADTALTGVGHTDGTTAGADAITHTCVDSSGRAPRGAPEDDFYFTLCPGQMRHLDVDTCRSQTTYDTVLFALGPGFDHCNDDGGGGCGQSSKLVFDATGPGLVQIFVDGWDGASGDYRFQVNSF